MRKESTKHSELVTGHTWHKMDREIWDLLGRVLTITPSTAMALGGGWKDEGRVDHIDVDYWRRRKDVADLIVGLEPEPILILAGNTVRQEEKVREMKDLGFIVARFSIFYGGKSGYTGTYPEEAGYSLDFPKNLEVLRPTLTNKEMLKALDSRELNYIEEVVAKVNAQLREPILITPYLKEALKK